MEELSNEMSNLYLDSYLIEAGNPEEAYSKSISLLESLNDAYRDDSGERVDIKAKGIYELADTQVHNFEKETKSGLQLTPISINSEFLVKEKEELELFKQN